MHTDLISRLLEKKYNFTYLFYLGKCLKMNISYLFSQFILLFIFYCSIIVVPIFPHYSSPLYPLPTSQIRSPPLPLSMGPLFMFLDLTLPLLSPFIQKPSKYALIILNIKQHIKNYFFYTNIYLGTL